MRNNSYVWWRGALRDRLQGGGIDFFLVGTFLATFLFGLIYLVYHSGVKDISMAFIMPPFFLFIMIVTLFSPMFHYAVIYMLLPFSLIIIMYAVTRASRNPVCYIIYACLCIAWHIYVLEVAGRGCASC